MCCVELNGAFIPFWDDANAATCHESYFLIHSHSSSHLICIGAEAHLTYSMPFRLTSQCYLPDPSIGLPIVLPLFGIIIWHTSLSQWALDQVFTGSKVHISQIDAFQTQSSRHTSLIQWPPDQALKDIFPMPPLIIWLSYSLASSASTPFHCSNLSHQAVQCSTAWDFSP